MWIQSLNKLSGCSHCTNPSEIRINGMSFSRLASKWANTALVGKVLSKDFDSPNFYGLLAGVEFQVLFSRSIFFTCLFIYLCSFLFLSTQIVKSEENNHMEHIVPLPVKQPQFFCCYNSTYQSMRILRSVLDIL